MSTTENELPKTLTDLLTIPKKLKTRMTGGLLRNFLAGGVPDHIALYLGYDPDAVRKHHHKAVELGRRIREQVAKGNTNGDQIVAALRRKNGKH